MFLLVCWLLSPVCLLAAPQPVVILADGGPVVLRLDITIDGKDFRDVHRAAQAAYLDALFAWLDTDGDGILGEAEARRMPPPFKAASEAGAGGIHVAFNYRVVDADGDGKVSRAELAEYHREFGGGTAQTQPTPRNAVPATASEALFARLDTDKDGKLSAAELAAASEALTKSDLDRDELITPAELLPGAALTPGMPIPVDPPGMPARPPARPVGTLFIVATDDDREALASALVRRYGGPSRTKLTAERLSLAPADFAALDADKSGDLNAAELARLADAVGGTVVTVPLGKPDAAPTATVKRDDLTVEVRPAAGMPTQPAGARGRQLDLFRAADAAKKGRLSPVAATAAGIPPAMFATLDRDGDGGLTETELAKWLDDVQPKQAALLAATPSLLLSDRGAGLFDRLDTDRDGRLSPRELQGAKRLPAGLTREEAMPAMVLAVGLGQASFRAGGPPPYSPRESPLLTVEWGRPDLKWFARTDRNGDGDLSAREFLGPLDAFRKLDADGDGLVSREEALRAAELFPAKR